MWYFGKDPKRCDISVSSRIFGGMRVIRSFAPLSIVLLLTRQGEWIQRSKNLERRLRIVKRDKEGETIEDGILVTVSHEERSQAFNFFFPSCNFSLVLVKSIETIRAKLIEGFGIMEDANPRTYYANKSKKPPLPEITRYGKTSYQNPSC